MRPGWADVSFCDFLGQGNGFVLPGPVRTGSSCAGPVQLLKSVQRPPWRPRGLRCTAHSVRRNARAKTSKRQLGERQRLASTGPIARRAKQSHSVRRNRGNHLHQWHSKAMTTIPETRTRRTRCPNRPTGRRQRALQVVPAAANGTRLPQHHHKPRQRQHQHPLVLTPRGGQKLGTRSQRSSARQAWARSNLKSTSTRERLRMRLPLPLHSPAWPPQQIWPIWLQPRPRPRPRPPPGPSPHLCSTR